MLGDHLPLVCDQLLDELVQSGYISDKPDQLTINRYRGENGDHIPLHVDTHSMCTEWIVTLSLGSNIVMNFEQDGHDDSNTTIQSKVYLRQRSLMIMKNQSRYGWKHGISQTSVDLVPFSLARINQSLSVASSRVALIGRGERYSLTFRKTTLPGFQCRCDFPMYCDVSSINRSQNARFSIPK